MRNAGDSAPGGSGGRRGRPRPPEQPSPADATGGASLFTPAYRASRVGARPAGRGVSGSGAPAGTPSAYGADLPGPGYSRSDPEPDPARTGGTRSGYDAHDSGPGWDVDPLAPEYGWADDGPGAQTWPGSDAAARETAVQPRGNAVRGFPPAPGEPLPIYPPGPFAAWNRGRSGRAGEGTGSTAGGYASSSGQLATATITPDEFDTDYSLPAIKDPLPGKAGSEAAQRTGAHGRRSAVSGTVTQQPRAPRGGRASGKERAARTRKRRLSATLAITAAGAIVAAVALILVLSNPGPATPSPNKNRGNSPGPSATSPAAPAGKWKYIGSRATDSVPLTLVELYPAHIVNGATMYTRAAVVNGKNCHGSLIGSALQAAVRRGGCSQELRATYLSRSAKVMATIGVFNLKNAALASKAATKAGRSQFVAQLPAKTGPTQAIGQGTGLEEALVKGHYLVLIWAEATNLSAPRGAAARKHISAVMSLLINRTVNVSLSTRMVDGRPPKRH
jgi:hypothetical protein